MAGISRTTIRATVNAGKRATVAGTASAVLGTLANQRTREMQALAASVGQNVDTMEALAVAGKALGFNYDNIVDLAEEMHNKLGEFAGLGEMNSAKEALEMIGLEFKDLKKLKPEDQFEKIVDAIAGMEDAQKASSAADMLFGGEASKFFGDLRPVSSSSLR
ncbi:MAG: hypothetical protein ACU0CI_11575 [Shimia sp.]